MPAGAHPQQHNSRNYPARSHCAPDPVSLPLRARRDLSRTPNCADENYGPSPAPARFENHAIRCLCPADQNLRKVDATRGQRHSKRLARRATPHSKSWRVITSAAAQNARKVYFLPVPRAPTSRVLMRRHTCSAQNREKHHPANRRCAPHHKAK